MQQIGVNYRCMTRMPKNSHLFMTYLLFHEVIELYAASADSYNPTVKLVQALDNLFHFNLLIIDITCTRQDMVHSDHEIHYSLIGLELCLIN